MERGENFDAIVEQVFAIQLTGRGKTPEAREKILRKPSGIKEAPKKKEKKGAQGGEKVHAVAAARKQTDLTSAAAQSAHKTAPRGTPSPCQRRRKTGPRSPGKG